MRRSLHVRLDVTSAAPEIIRSTGLSDSEAVRTSLREAAAGRRVRSAISARTIAVDGNDTRVLVEQATVVDAQRLGRSAGVLYARE